MAQEPKRKNLRNKKNKVFQTLGKTDHAPESISSKIEVSN
jgi:hypothetical protein